MSSDSREDIFNPPRKKIKIEPSLEDNKIETDSKVETARDEGMVQQMFTKQVEEMKNELKCGICHEEFISATTLNCSHTFCSYCITMWKKKKKSCPICQIPITSECRSLIIDSFVRKLMENQPEEVKRKRQELMKTREKCQSELERELSKRSSHVAQSLVEGDNDNLDSVDALFRFLRYIKCPECGENLGSDFDIDSDLHLSDTNISTMSELDNGTVPEAEAVGAEDETPAAHTVAADADTDAVITNIVLNSKHTNGIQSAVDSNKTT